jgi:hypothetical protein
MRKLLSHTKRYHRWLINKRNFKRTMKEMFVEEVTQPMPWWGWVITGIGLTIMIYASINY